jgi:hypothetical protein
MSAFLDALAAPTVTVLFTPIDVLPAVLVKIGNGYQGEATSLPQLSSSGSAVGSLHRHLTTGPHVSHILHWPPHVQDGLAEATGAQ